MYNKKVICLPRNSIKTGDQNKRAPHSYTLNKVKKQCRAHLHGQGIVYNLHRYYDLYHTTQSPSRPLFASRSHSTYRQYRFATKKLSSVLAQGSCTTSTLLYSARGPAYHRLSTIYCFIRASTWSTIFKHSTDTTILHDHDSTIVWIHKSPRTHGLPTRLTRLTLGRPALRTH
jgi:hypothetical protein